MKNLIHTAVVTLFAASAAQAQQAVQWKVEDGGNGHWYKLQLTGPVTWGNARTLAESVGGHLATSTSDSENSLLVSLAQRPDAWINDDYGNTGGPYLGGYQPVGSDASSAWKWVTGEPWNWTGWAAGEPNNGFQPGVLVTALLGYPPAGANYRGWADAYADGTSPLDPVQYPLLISCLVEWEADCNSDGIVDYGQCRDGTLADYNTNNIPDCCEQGVQCTVGNYPVQWRVEDGGNGHWYAVGIERTPLTWTQAQSACTMQGAALASLGTQAESDWVFEVLVNDVGPWSYFGRYVVGPWIGGRGRLGNWQWDDGSVWNFAAWLPGEGLPNSDPNEQFAHYFAGVGALVPRNAWGDYYDGLVTASFVLEWSADCNNDNIVDYGQILTGQLADANTDGIPDICQQPTCREADLFRDLNVNGADLGILLSQWGPNAQFTVSDINQDGSVNGADLGLLLSFWGACP